MHTIRQVLAAKGGDIWSVSPNDTVIDAVRRMAERGVGALLVLEQGKAVGMFSERDYARKIILAGRSSRETRVADIMTTTLTTISPGAVAEEGLALMTHKRIRHLPVVEDGELLGMVSIGDLVNVVIQDQQALIEHLERYVTG